MTRSPLFHVTALASGVLFGLGLAISQMIDPAKIWNFLDFAAIPTGGWDPSLAFVMGGGVLVAFFGMRADRWLRKPVAGPAFIKTHRTRIDAQLVAGAATFGVGWGLSGFCPGPAFADFGLMPLSVGLFVLALLTGSWIAGTIMERPTPAAPVEPASARA
jgi:uncharacterized membrane protein YedE/YeeE